MSISKKQTAYQSLNINITKLVLNDINDINVKISGRVKSIEILLNNSDQVILPKTHQVSKLIISHYHRLTLHSGKEQALALVREKLWIPACRGLGKQVINSCPLCKC